MKSIASISSIEYELGKSYKIEESELLANDPDKLLLYHNEGLKYYNKTDLPVIELCYRSITKTIRSSNIDKSHIDYIIYVSENATRDYCINIIDINKLLIRLDLIHANPIGISLSDCANILTGLQMAASLIASDMARNVLLVCSDKIVGDKENRKMKPEMSILSDGAASCIVSKPNTGDFNIQFITNKNSPLQWNNTDRNNNYSLQKLKQINAVSKKILKEYNLEPKNFSKVFTNNYYKNISITLLEMAGFKKEQGYFLNIERFGHTLAGDILINIKDFSDTGELNTGELFFLLVDSYSSCGSMIFIKN